MSAESFQPGLLQSLIAARHAADPKRWALFYELRNGTGFVRQERYIDAFAIDTWPSGKARRIAYEIKTARSDFLRELKQPEKRAWALEVSNEFWFVCAPDVAKPDEVPEGCGLLVATKAGDKLRTVKHAQHREARDFTMIEVAAILRCADVSHVTRGLRWRYANQVIDGEKLDAIIADERDRATERAIEAEVRARIEKDRADLRKTMQVYADELRKAGIEPPNWMIGAGGFGVFGNWSAQKWIERNLKPGPAWSKVERARRQLEEAKASIERAERTMAEIQDPATAADGASHAHA